MTSETYRAYCWFCADNRTFVVRWYEIEHSSRSHRIVSGRCQGCQKRQKHVRPPLAASPPGE